MSTNPNASSAGLSSTKRVMSSHQERVEAATSSDLPPRSPSFTNGSFKKLLNSHSSIYNALNNPDLDVSPTLGSGPASASRLTPDLFDPQSFSVTSWHNISNESFLQDSRNQSRNQSPGPSKLASNRPSSILSLSTDDEAKESMIIVQSPKASSKVMLFETDEEDLEDLEEFKNPSSFIMPKMSVSSQSQSKSSATAPHQPSKLANSTNSPSKPHFQISILSSASSYNKDTNQLIRHLEAELDDASIKFHHLVLKASYLSKSKVSSAEITRFKKSDLIFIVNDGSKSLVDFLASLFNTETNDSVDEDEIPKHTIINIMTVNYFVNLFELINNIKPYQIWKTSSLKQEKLINKFKDFIRAEFSQSEIFVENFNQLSKRNRELGMKLASASIKKSASCQAQSQAFENIDLTGSSLNIPKECLNISEPNLDYLSRLSQRDSDEYLRQLAVSQSKFCVNPTNSMYSNLIPTKRSDYKSIEKQFKSDLQSSYQFNDPLKISSSSFTLCYSIIKKMIQKNQNLFSDDSKKLWLFLSFSLGIGLGIGLTSGTDSIVSVGFYCLDNCKASIGNLFHQSTIMSSLNLSTLDNPVNSEQVTSSAFEVSGFNPVNSFSEIIENSIDSIKNSKLYDDLSYCMKGVTKNMLYTGSLVLEGFEKVMGLLLFSW